MPLTAIDRDALERALVACRAQSKARAEQIDHMLADPSRSWQEVARFASYSAQMDSLRLNPWQSPPCQAGLNDLKTQPPGDPRGKFESAALLQRLLEAGLSGYEPDPLAAITEAEQRQAVK